MSNIVKKLSNLEWAELKDLIRQVNDRKTAMFEMAELLTTIKDKQLYREHGTFAEFCEKTFKFRQAYLYRLVQGLEAKKSLPPALSTIVENPAVAAAVAAVPPEQRAAVVQAAVEATDGHVTAAAVTQAAADIQEAEVIVTDANGRTVPAGIVDAWQKATTEGNRLTKMLHEVKLAVQRGVNDDDPTFTRCHNSDVADFDRVYYKIKNDVTPHVVCTTCQGVHAKKCKHCYGTGWLTMFQWKNLAEDIRKLAEKTGRKAAQ